MSDFNPVSVPLAVESAKRAIAQHDKQARFNRKRKRYDADTYARLLRERRERERVTGNHEEGPL